MRWAALIFWRELEREFCPDPSLSDRGVTWSKNTPPLVIASSASFAHRHHADPVLLGADSGVYDHSPVAPNGDFDSFRLWRSADPAGAELGSVSSVVSWRSQLPFAGGPAPIGREAFIEAAAKPEPLGVCGLRRGRVTSSRNARLCDRRDYRPNCPWL